MICYCRKGPQKIMEALCMVPGLEKWVSRQTRTRQPCCSSPRPECRREGNSRAMREQTLKSRCQHGQLAPGSAGVSWGHTEVSGSQPFQVAIECRDWWLGPTSPSPRTWGHPVCPWDPLIASRVRDPDQAKIMFSHLAVLNNKGIIFYSSEFVDQHLFLLRESCFYLKPITFVSPCYNRKFWCGKDGL